MKVYQYIKNGMVCTVVLNDPGEFCGGSSTNDGSSATEEQRRQDLRRAHARFRHFRLCTDGYWRDPKQCVEKKK